MGRRWYFSLATMRLKSERISSYPTTIYRNEEIVDALAHNGFYYEETKRLPTCYECGGIEEIHKDGCFIPRFNRLMETLKETEETPNYTLLNARLFTFKDGWEGYCGCEMNWDEENDYISSPDEIAAAGFFFTGMADHLKCPFCSIIVRFSTHKKINITQHRKLNPYCSFVNNSIENFDK